MPDSSATRDRLRAAEPGLSGTCALCHNEPLAFLSMDPPRVQRSELLAALTRYRALVDDWSAFEAALARPLPTCIWANPLRIAPEDLAALAAADGLDPKPLPGHRDAFTIADKDALGSHWWYIAGLAHAQERVSLLPATLLQPEPGDRVLDLCAAPGGKTARIAAAMDNRGTVVANDVSAQRMRPLRANLERLGLINVSTTIADGCNFPPQAGLFDRVLVDAPCSGEGTLRKHRRLSGAIGEAISRDYSRRQRALLRKAVQLCRPGGRIVYSTCTFAPEENEEVVDAVLQERANGDLRLESIELPGLHTVPGLTEWNARPLHPDLAASARLWPHHNDTGGFYLACLVKSPNAEPGPAGEHTQTAELADASPWQATLSEPYGLEPQLWERARLIRTRKHGLSAIATDHLPPSRPQASAMGVAFLQTGSAEPKLTTAGALLAGPYAHRRIVDLTDDQLTPYLARQSLDLAPAQVLHCERSGFVLVRYRGHVLGTGLYRLSTHTLESLFPKRWTGISQPRE